MKKIEQNKEIFEIQNSDINVKELMAEIESNLMKRTVDKKDIERIAKLKLSADSPAGHRLFDPSHVANLFEKGIAPPKFSNPRYWFIRGPLKWAIVKFTEMYSIVDKKLSENRIKAFYSVLHELILLKAKHQNLEQKFNELYKDIVELKAATRPSNFENNYFDNNKVLGETFHKSNERILSLLQSEHSTLVLFPDWENFLNLLKVNRISFDVIVQNQTQLEHIQSQITNRVSKIESLEMFSKFQDYSNIILHCNACLLPAWSMESLILNLKAKAKKKTLVLLRFSNSAVNFYSPFQVNYQTRINLEKLLSYLKEQEFKNIISHSVDKDEMNLISFFVP